MVSFSLGARASGVIKMISQNVHLGFLIHILISEAPSAPRKWQARGAASQSARKDMQRSNPQASRIELH